MSRLDEIEKAVQNLPESELRRFRQWFANFDAELWDARIESDAAAGKLDALAREALDEHDKGGSSEF